MSITVSLLLIHLFSHLLESCELYNNTDFLNEQTVLYNALMKNYNPKLPAISTIDNASLAVGADLPRFEVSLELSFLHLISVVESQQKVDFVLDYRMSWTDERLRWTPSDYCGINELYLSREDVWIPEVTIVSVLSTIDYREDFKKFVSLNSSGFVKFFVPTATSTVCTIKTHDFPFDSQVCPIKLMAQTFSVRHYGIKAKFFTADTSRIEQMGNGEWQVTNVSVWSNRLETLDGNLAERNDINISLKRNPAFYVTVIITPSFLINVICILGLFIKADRMTKLGMALTNIMSLTFILGILSTLLPKTDEIPKIGIFVVANMAIMMASLCVVLLLPYVRLPCQRVTENETIQQNEKLEFGKVVDKAEVTTSMWILNIAVHILFQSANLANFLVLIL